MVNRQVNRRDKNARGGFVYKPSDPKRVKERSENTGSQFESIFNKGIDSWRPKVGDNQIRICPPTWKDHEHYGYEVWVHSYVGADSSTYLCLKKMLGKKCPICTAAKEAADAGEGDEAKQLKATNKFIYWIIDRDGDSQMPQAWMVSRQMDGEIAALSYSKKSGNVLQIDNPTKGYDLMFKRVGQMLKTRYIGMQIDRDRSPIMDKNKDADAVLEYIKENPLDTVLKFRDKAFLAEAIEGTGKTKDADLDDEDEDDEDDEPKKKGRGRSRDDDDEDEDDTPKKKKRRVRDDDDEDEDDDDEPKKRRRGRDDDEDEDDDDEPKKKKRRVRDDDDDDEDEDDKPKKKKRRDDDEDDDDPADEDDDDGDDDDDDEPKGKRAKGKSSSRGKKDDDDEDDDDADDDEDEDDKPRKRRRR